MSFCGSHRRREDYDARDVDLDDANVYLDVVLSFRVRSEPLEDDDQRCRGRADRALPPLRSLKQKIDHRRSPRLASRVARNSDPCPHSGQRLPFASISPTR